MARIETDPNYSSPTFPRADAATDLFKKEDVQQLAAAMSTHNHAPGKGLTVSIPSGLITSSMIADRTIQAVDIGLSTIGTPELTGQAVHRQVGMYSATPSFSTTGTTAQVATPVSHVGTYGGVGDGYCRVDLLVPVTVTIANTTVYAWLYLDGGNQGLFYGLTCTQVGVLFPIIFSNIIYVGSGTSHTLTLYLTNTNPSNTLAIAASFGSNMTIWEVKR